MTYIVFDLEFNQAVSTDAASPKPSLFFEILQVGALKLDTALRPMASFNQLVKPSLYTQVSPFITALTGITTENVIDSAPFSKVYYSFLDFVNDSSAIFCTWGMSDIKELFRNASYHQCSTQHLPKRYINIQPCTSLHLGLTPKKLLNLQDAVSRLHIPQSEPFHNAYYDAYYTSEIFKKIYTSQIKSSLYDPHYVRPPKSVPKKEIDFQALIFQFKKMYDRPLTEEEIDIIKLAYKMGKTGQFLKEV